MRKFNFKEAVVQNAVQELHDCWHLLQISPFSCTVQHLFVFVCFFFLKNIMWEIFMTFIPLSLKGDLCQQHQFDSRHQRQTARSYLLSFRVPGREVSGEVDRGRSGLQTWRSRLVFYAGLACHSRQACGKLYQQHLYSFPVLVDQHNHYFVSW